jgi:chromosome segregation ATPase
MKEIKWIAENIHDELEDAEKYAKAASKYKESDRELARLCATLAEEELTHADRLHREAVRVIKAYKDEGKEVPTAMQVIWDWEHEKMIDRTARIRHLIALYNQ